MAVEKKEIPEVPKNFWDVKKGMTFITAGRGGVIYEIDRVGSEWAFLKCLKGKRKGQEVKVKRADIPKYIHKMLEKNYG